MENIIVMDHDRDRIINMSLYEFIDWQYKWGNHFIVCHVTEEEYVLMVKQIGKGGLKERLARISKEELGYDKFRYLMAYNYRENCIAIADYDQLEKKGSYILDKNGITFHEDRMQFPKDMSVARFIGPDFRIYTTESYDDVVNYYLEKKNERESFDHVKGDGDNKKLIKKSYLK